MQPAAVPPQAAVTRSALKDRLLDPRTLISFGILAVVLFVVLTHVQFDYGDSLRAISQTNVLIYALAFVAFYFSFVVRTIRWEILLRNTKAVFGVAHDLPVIGLGPVQLEQRELGVVQL